MTCFLINILKHLQISVRGGAAAAVMLACWHYAPTLTHIHTKHFLSQRRWWSSTAIPATATATTAASPAFKYTTAAAVLLLLDSWPAQQQQGQPAVVEAVLACLCTALPCLLFSPLCSRADYSICL